MNQQNQTSTTVEGRRGGVKPINRFWNTESKRLINHEGKIKTYATLSPKQKLYENETNQPKKETKKLSLASPNVPHQIPHAKLAANSGSQPQPDGTPVLRSTAAFGAAASGDCVWPATTQVAAIRQSPGGRS